MTKTAFRSALVLLAIFGSANAAFADVAPEPDPSNPTSIVIGLGVLLAASGLGYFIYRRRRK